MWDWLFILPAHQCSLSVSPYFRLMLVSRMHQATLMPPAYFFDLAGNDDPFLVTVILGVVGLAACVVDAICVDRFGRRFMTVMGFSGACFGITLIAIIGCFDYESKSLGSVLVFGGVVANFFNTVQSSTSYAYLTEMPELRFRARATGWGLAYCNL